MPIQIAGAYALVEIDSFLINDNDNTSMRMIIDESHTHIRHSFIIIENDNHY